MDILEMEEVKRSSQEQNLQGGIILESVRKMRENKELVDLAADLQVRGLTEIVPADIVSNSESCSVFVDIMANITGEVLPQKKVKELNEGDKDLNHNGGVQMSYTKKENIHVMETAIVVNTIDEDVEGQQDENDNSTNGIIEVADILENTNDHNDDPINNAEGDREDDPLDFEDNKRSDKANFELLIVTGSEKRNGTSEQHRLICSKMAKVGVKEFRRYLCKDCEITGARDFIYDHIAEEHGHVDVHNEKEGHMDDMIDNSDNDCGSNKIIPKVNPVPSVTELQVSFTKVGKLESSEAKTNGSDQIIANPKKRKGVTFSPNNPEVFFYEREDKTYFKKRCPSGGQNEDNEGDCINTQSEDTVNACKENKASVVMDSKLRLLASGIISMTQQGFRVQDKPQKIKDLDTIQKKYKSKKIIKASQNSNVKRKAGKILSITQQGFRVQNKPQKIKDLDTIQKKFENKRIIKVSQNSNEKRKAGRILSITQQGFRVQDKPQKIKDLDTIQKKYKSKEIINASQKPNEERKVKKKRS